ncbi:hypothetical protein P8452_01961 [Trifolium repens]|nr:hypothetical protein P8452_01961 [Trifolium repens]
MILRLFRIFWLRSCQHLRRKIPTVTHAPSRTKALPIQVEVSRTLKKRLQIERTNPRAKIKTSLRPNSATELHFAICERGLTRST